MVTRINKSSKSRKGTEYILLWRIQRELGSQGWKVIERALNGDVKAMDRIEKLAYTPRKRPALVAWVKRVKARVKKRLPIPTLKENDNQQRKEHN